MASSAAAGGGKASAPAAAAAAAGGGEGKAPDEAARQRALAEKQQAEIDAEVAAQPAAGAREPLTVLLAEYRDNPSFHGKIAQLVAKPHYTGVRRSRGDGNCFYRSVAFQWLDAARVGGQAEAARQVAHHDEILDGLCNALGYERMMLEAFHEAFCDALRAAPDTSVASLEAQFADDASMYFVYWVRLCTSFSVQARAEQFFPFIVALGFSDAKAFCTNQIEPVKVDADQLPIQALAEHTGWSIRIEYLDGGGGELNHHDFGPAAGSGASRGAIHLLYRPGHYDMLSVAEGS